MKSIFENAYFGKLYKTRDNRKAIYIRDFICNGINHLVTTGNVEFAVNEEGKVDNNLYQFGVDIISEWQEEIDEEKLNTEAYFEANRDYYDDCNGDSRVSFEYERKIFIEGFKKGYCKAK